MFKSTIRPNAEVGAIHPKAMPVILTTPAEVETWMPAPRDEDRTRHQLGKRVDEILAVKQNEVHS
jgi:putative SOS response-associated peptidase YedK